MLFRAYGKATEKTMENVLSNSSWQKSVCFLCYKFLLYRDTNHLLEIVQSIPLVRYWNEGCLLMVIDLFTGD